MQLLTILGISNYQTTYYTWQGQPVKQETRYVAEALCEFFQPEKVTVFVTAEAKEMHWQDLSQNLSNRFPEITLVDALIPPGKSEEEVWQIFDAVVNSVEPSSKVLFDITLAFRSISMLLLLAAAFLQRARDVKIQGVYYGAFEANRNYPPIFDLTPAIKLLDWLTATDKFLSTGSSIDLGQLLSTIQQDFYQTGQPEETGMKPIRLKSMGDRIQTISRSLELIRPMDLLQEAAQLQKLPAEQLRNEVGVFAKPFELLLDQIQRDYGQFALPDSRNADPKQVLQKQFLLLRWYVLKDLGGQAILLAREWLVSALCIAQGRNYLDREERGSIESDLNKILSHSQSKQPDAEDISDIQQAMSQYVVDLESLAATWSKLVEYRNDIAHAQMRPNSISAPRLQAYVREKLLKELTTLFPHVTA